MRHHTWGRDVASRGKMSEEWFERESTAAYESSVHFENPVETSIAVTSN